MFDQILQVKKIRLDKAEKHMRACRDAVAVAEQRLQEHIQAVAQYKQFIVTEKDRLFQEIHNSEVGLKSVDAYNAKVSKMYEELEYKEKQTSEFEQAVVDAKTNYQKSIDDHQQAVSNVEKTKELLVEVRTAEQEEATRKEEIELEDVNAKVHNIT